MSKIALIDIAERVVRTFIQATGAALATGAGGLVCRSTIARYRPLIAMSSSCAPCSMISPPSIT